MFTLGKCNVLFFDGIFIVTEWLFFPLHYDQSVDKGTMFYLNNKTSNEMKIFININLHVFITWKLNRIFFFFNP